MTKRKDIFKFDKILFLNTIPELCKSFFFLSTCIWSIKKWVSKNNKHIPPWSRSLPGSQFMRFRWMSCVSCTPSRARKASSSVSVMKIPSLMAAQSQPRLWERKSVWLATTNRFSTSSKKRAFSISLKPNSVRNATSRTPTIFPRSLLPQRITLAVLISLFSPLPVVRKTKFKGFWPMRAKQVSSRRSLLRLSPWSRLPVRQAKSCRTVGWFSRWAISAKNVWLIPITTWLRPRPSLPHASRIWLPSKVRRIFASTISLLVRSRLVLPVVWRISIRSSKQRLMFLLSTRLCRFMMWAMWSLRICATRIRPLPVRRFTWTLVSMQLLLLLHPWNKIPISKLLRSLLLLNNKNGSVRNSAVTKKAIS